MPRDRSIKTKKQRRGRRAGKSLAAKPAKTPAAAPAMSLIRRIPHLERKLKSRILLLEKKAEYFEKCDAC
ncbi:hypothetical protein VTI74DRAFT_3782 [Chaetomium olivicolor]